MTTRNLDQWLAYQLGVHALGVDLGLARVEEVWRRMGAPTVAPLVITVGGTNGKGSTVAFLEAILRASDLRIAAFTSPHLLRYNERVRIDGIDVDDAPLIAAFEVIEAARTQTSLPPISLTYFEFGTLAALWIFAHSNLDVAVLEVGLGGRLDAVNIIDADAAIVTTVDLDHQDWLGTDRDAIAREKAGIFRAGRPAIIGDVNAPEALALSAHRIGAELIVAGDAFTLSTTPRGWSWCGAGLELELPPPSLAAPAQRANAAAAIAALHAMRARLPLAPDAFARGVSQARIQGRLQRLHCPERYAELVIDVAHNPQAARVLGDWLMQNPASGRNIAVFGALDDKDIAGIVVPLADAIATWHIAGLDQLTTRGYGAAALATRVRLDINTAVLTAHATVSDALNVAFAGTHSEPGCVDRVIAFGSFYLASEALHWAARSGFA